jgi:sulfate adenylyltransferase
MLRHAGVIQQFSGISDPYEDPHDADIAIDIIDLTPEEAAQAVILHLEREGYIGVNGAPPQAC